MLGWALLINNLGRRRYPLHWWAPGRTFVVDPEEVHDEPLRQMEEADVQRDDQEEGDLSVESDETGSKLGKKRRESPSSSPEASGIAPSNSNWNDREANN